MQEIKNNWDEGNFVMRGAKLEGIVGSNFWPTRFPKCVHMDDGHIAVAFSDSSVDIFNRKTFQREKVI